MSAGMCRFNARILVDESTKSILKEELQDHPISLPSQRIINSFHLLSFFRDVRERDAHWE